MAIFLNLLKAEALEGFLIVFCPTLPPVTKIKQGATAAGTPAGSHIL